MPGRRKAVPPRLDRAAELPARARAPRVGAHTAGDEQPPPSRQGARAATASRTLWLLGLVAASGALVAVRYVDVDTHVEQSVAAALGVLMALGLAVRSGGRASPRSRPRRARRSRGGRDAVARPARRRGRRHRRARGVPGGPRHDPGAVVRPRGRRGPRRRAARHRGSPRGGRLPRRHRPGPLRVHRPGPRHGDDRGPGLPARRWPARSRPQRPGPRRRGAWSCWSSVSPTPRR